MGELLDKVDSAEDLRKLNSKEKKQLAEEYREEILKIVSKNGGHLASNLGVVELTMALHSVFNLPEDKIIWDVGHQTYVHKMLTGRKDKMNTLRQLGGIAGFPKTAESECDCFNTGHSSTSISVAMGMARTRDIRKEKHSVVAVIGDGALTGGMALEALNEAGSSGTNIIVILNDNEMSISKNVGGIALFLSRARTRKVYTKSNNYIKKTISKIPRFGDWLVRRVRMLKYSIKQLMIPNMMFEDMGFTYMGPIDGHDIDRVESYLRTAKKIEGPVLVHVVTKKGKGYEPAEKNPDKFHGVGSFNLETGESTKPKKKDYSKAFGEKLVELAEKNKKIVAVTAAMKDGTGLRAFSEKFPDRFFDIGIAEQHAVGMAAGMARDGMIPVVPIYSSFYQRCYDQVIHDVCIQKLPVVLCADRAGIVGADGETHQGTLDLSFFNVVPNLNIMAPKDFQELGDMLEFATNLGEPIFMRYPRGGEGNYKFEKHEEIVKGKAEILKEGTQITIIAIGKMVDRAMQVNEILKQENIDAEIINARFLKPIDEETIIKSIKKTKNVITLEDNSIKGGLGSTVSELIVKNNLHNVKMKKMGYPDEFIKHGTQDEIEKIYGLNAEAIAKYIKENV